MVTSEDFCRLSRRLERHHALFYLMWQMGKPVMDASIPTACVRFSSTGELLEFAFNPDFWNECTDDDRLFVIAHECLHVLFKHGIRTASTKEPERCNVALDLVVNHTLVNSFGFIRDNITNWSNYCWADTVFTDKEVKTDLAFEEYFNMLPPTDINGGMVDDHKSWCGDSQKVIDNIFGKTTEGLESINEITKKHTGQEVFVVSTSKPKKKWETVIQKWASKWNRHDSNEIEQWARLHRRYTFLGNDLILPSDMEDSEAVKELGKIEVWFFQDVSGSCAGFVKRFFDAANSLPPERFDVKLHCFDTQVQEVALKSGKIEIGGGTYFDCIEEYIQIKIREKNIPYPQAVFVITDGYGNSVFPEWPERWYWFLSTDYSNYIPKNSHLFKLKDFE